MSNVLGTLFGDIAGAIRAKTGETGKMKPGDFPGKILSIVTGSGDKELVCATGEFEITSGVKTIAHNLGVSPDIVVYFLSTIGNGTYISNSSGYITGEIAYSSEMMEDGAKRMMYLCNGSSFEPQYGMFIDNADMGSLGGVRAANPETFKIGQTGTNYFCPGASYRWAAIGGLKTHNEFYTARFYDGETLLKTEVVPFATVVTPPTPEKEGYALSWSPANMTVKQDTDFVAVWTEIKRWTTVQLADYETDTSGTYQVSVGSECYAQPCVQFIQGATWTGGASSGTKLDETHSVFAIGDIVSGKTSIEFTEKVSWTGRSGSTGNTDCLYIYVNWFDVDGNFITYNSGSVTGTFSGKTSRTVTKTFTIPEGAYYVGVCAKFGGYVSSATFTGISATLKMVVS